METQLAVLGAKQRKKGSNCAMLIKEEEEVCLCNLRIMRRLRILGSDYFGRNQRSQEGKNQSAQYIKV